MNIPDLVWRQMHASQLLTTFFLFPKGDCNRITIDLMALVKYPEVTLRVGGPDRWRGTLLQLGLSNGYKYYFGIPAGFVDGSDPETLLPCYGGRKFL